MNNVIAPKLLASGDAPSPFTVDRKTFRASDDTELNYKAWLPAESAARALVLLHRGHEHADRWDDVVPHWAAPGTAIFAWEARGHGQSPGQRGHAPTFMTYVRDLECFMRHLAVTQGIPTEQTIVIAHSVGAVVAAAWTHDYGPPLAGLVLATPAFEVKLYVPGALAGSRLMAALNPGATIKSYVRGHWLTRDAEQAKLYNADHTISRDISARILVGLFDTSKRVIDDAAVMETPLLLLSAGNDSVVKNSAHERFFERYGGQVKRHLGFPGARHALFHDLCRPEVTEAIRHFAEARWSEARPRAAVGAENPATRAEYDALRKPAPLASIRKWSFAIQRLSLGTLGRLSHGVNRGWKTGFDSGESLDYVYENQAQGRTPIGRLIDRSYLNAIGWRGIRQRREMLRAALTRALGKVKQQGLPARLADIAGGGGRYLLDLLRNKETDPELRVLCRDWSDSALAVGRAAAERDGLSGRITFEKADAFSEASVAGMEPRPSVAVVSGLYELFPDNERLQRSLRGLAAALGAGGWLVYTNQPWHPQVEMIARVLINRDAKPWIMRRRPQSEMDALVREAGFQKQAQWTDDFGIFTVALAEKVNQPSLP